jgi:hypothetical protein
MEISNFTGSQSLHVEIHQHNGTKFITMQQYGQSMRFQMDITPEEARKFAQHLIECADIVEVK